MAKYGELTWGQTEALINKLGGEEVVRDILADKVKWTITEQVKKLLDHIGTIRVPGAENFIATDHFKIDTSRKATVKIAWMSDNFRSFLSKVEKNVPAGELNSYTLTQPSLDAPIITELGERHETHLADLWAALKNQPSGESGTLLTNGYANIFYIRNWAVYAYWDAVGGGWSLYASSVEGPRGWHAGHRVLSR